MIYKINTKFMYHVKTKTDQIPHGFSCQKPLYPGMQSDHHGTSSGASALMRMLKQEETFPLI